MRLRFTRGTISAMAALAVVVALHTGVWFWATGQEAASAEAWAAAQRARGWSVSFTPAGRAGWPLAAYARVTDLHITGFPPLIGVTAEHAMFGIDALHPTTAVLRIDGKLLVQLAGLPDLTLSADRLEARVPLAQGQAPAEADLDTDQLRIGSGDTTWLTVQSGHLHAAAAPATGALAQGLAQGLTMTLQAGPASLPDTPPPGAPPALWALGPTIQRLELAAELSLPKPGDAGLAAAATAWRDAGGVLKLTLAAFDWGKLSASGQASLALDAALQPAGQARLHLAGFAETLSALTAGHVIPPRTATAAGAILALLARRQPDGTMAVEAPLTLQDSVLQFGRIPLLRLPMLQWPTAR
jgi:hypothetical protein